MRSIISNILQGYRFIAIGSSTLCKIPIDWTFHDFLCVYLKKGLGKEWYKNEIKKADDERHIIIKWYYLDYYWKKQNANINKSIKGVWNPFPCGASWALLILAYDIYCLDHCMVSYEDLLNRLRDKNQFQGAKYEIGVSAIFARADYRIKYLKNKDKKTFEFIARNEFTKENIAVEAKSRHRQGILHFPKDKKQIKTLKLGISRMLNQALDQRPEDKIPYIIFIDINMKPVEGIFFDKKEWVEDLNRALDNTGEIDINNPQDFNVLFITNYSYHYSEFDEIDTSIYSKNTVNVVPQFVRNPFKNSNTFINLKDTIDHYGQVPHLWN